MVDLSLSADKSATVPTAGGAVAAKLDVGVDGWVLNLSAGCNLSDTERGRHDANFGARYLDLDTALNLSLGGASVGKAVTGGVWDGVVRVRGRANLQGKWYLPYYLDVGAGQPDLTWQVIGGLAYKYNWGDLSFSYRHIKWDFDSGSPFSDINFSGPGIRATWYF